MVLARLSAKLFRQYAFHDVMLVCAGTYSRITIGILRIVVLRDRMRSELGVVGAMLLVEAA